MNIPYPDQKLYNPILLEFAGLLTAVDHNSGVYYEANEVGDIFTTISDYVIASKHYRQELASLDDQNVQAVGQIIRAQLSDLMSIDGDRSLALIKSGDGSWETVGPDQYDAADDFSPLEITRQDNDDKAGKNKYRFRSPIYTRNRDIRHQKQVGDGWYTSEWHEDPSFWSTQLRNMLLLTASDVAEDLGVSGSTMIFITEGGVLKGTSTIGTDIDTSCIISCDSKDKFSNVNEIVRQAFGKRLREVQFYVKESGVRPIFFDSSSHEMYWRSDDGRFVNAKNTEVTETGSIHRSVRMHEKGVLVTTKDGQSQYIKPKDAQGKSVNIEVNLETGEVTPQPDEGDTLRLNTVNRPKVPADPAVDWDWV